MSVDFQNDRRDLASLHLLSNGMGSNTATSSSRMQLTQTPWSQPPTVIPPPGSNRKNPPKKPSAITNPYSRINNNISTSRGNPSALSLFPVSRGPIHSTISSRRSEKPAHKKLRLDTEQSTNRCSNMRLPNSGKFNPSMSASTSLEMEEIFSSSSNSGGRTPKRKKRARGDPPPHPDIFEVIDVDEDLGEPIAPPTSESSDDLRLHEGERPGQDPIGPPSIQTILETDPPSPQHPFNRREGQLNEFLPPPVGPQTGALKAKIDAQQAIIGNESDPIEDPDDTEDGDRPSAPYRQTRKATPSRTTEFPVNSVRNAIQDINRKTDVVGDIPQVDLAKTQRNKTGTMKPKFKLPKTMDLPSGSQSTIAHRPQKRVRKGLDLLMSPSGFQRNDKSHRLNKELTLPIEKWIFGSNIIISTKDSQHWLSVRNDRVSIIIRKADSTEEPLCELQLDREITGISLPYEHADTNAFAQLRFCISRTERSTKLFVNKEKDAKSLDVFVRFLQSDPTWSSANYDLIRQALKESSVSKQIVDSYARRTQWQGLEPEATQVDTSIFFTQPLRDRPKARPAYMGSSDIDQSEQRHSGTSPSSQPFLRRSTRIPRNVLQNSERARSPPADETIFLFPPTGTGAVNVTQGDLKRLEPGEYLNDTLIELGLKLWLQDLKGSRPELAEQVHVFSSFFYTQLNHKNVEEGYQSVRKWTSKFDLFRKKYIIIPINEHMHWYLAIICYPDRVLCQQTLTQPVVPNVTTRNRRHESLLEEKFHGNLKTQGAPPAETSNPMSTSSKSVAGDEQEVEMLVNTRTIPSSPSPTLAPDSPEGAIIPETDSEDERSFSDITMKRTSTRLLPAFPTSHELGTVSTTAFYASPDVKMRSASVEKEVEEGECNDGMEVDDPSPALEPEKADYPYIFSFDSLGSRHPHALKLLSRYLELEAKDKKLIPQTTPAITKQASVPTQSNYCDCGVYLLHFVERFMSDPDNFISCIADHAKSKKSADVIRQERETMWNHSVVENKREVLKQTVLSLASNWKREKEVEDKGKPEDEPCNTHSERIAIDNDSDIEVLELSPEPTKTVSSAGSQIPRQRKASRIR